MKKRLLMLLSLFMAVTSVGWVHAQDATTGSITSEITTAQKDKPIVFGITTKKGNVADNTMVRVSLTADNNAFDGWDSYYYEPNGNDPGWKKWDPKNDAFGPKEGFPFQDATSYIQVIPEAKGTFYYTLNVTKVGESEPFIAEKCTLIVENTSVSPIASIGGTDYASLATAVHFAKKDTAIKLTAGNFSLASQLVINKPLTLLGVADYNGNPQTNLIATAANDNSSVNLVSIEGTESGNVTLQNIRVQGSKASGINAQSKMTTKLVNVALEGNMNAGLLVHSVVEAKGLFTKNNGWGGVNVDKGTPEYTPSFKFDETSTFNESSQIWAEKNNIEPGAVTTPLNGNWYYFEDKGGKNNDVDMYYWTNQNTIYVKSATALNKAILNAKKGNVIVLTEAIYGTEGSVQSFGAINVPNVTIKADAALEKKPKLYGTIQIMADGCTVEGLEFHTKGGSHPFKNAIDVVAMSVTIKNNDFIMTTPASGSVGNGITIWPVGDAATASYIVTGNSFNGFTGTTGIWNSTAFQIADKCSLNEHFSGRQDISKEVQIANEQNYWTDNKFSNCDADYVHATWPSNAAVYSFVALSKSANNVFVLKEAVAKAAANAQIFVAGTYELDAKLLISKPLSLTGVISGKDTTTFTVTAKNSLNDHLIAVEGVNGTVSLSNLAIKKSQGYGLHLFNSNEVKLTSIGLSENKKGGLLVNGSTVTADKLTTEGNEWGGIEVAKGKGVTTDPKLTISNSTINEDSQIWADTDPSVEGSEKVAEWVAGTGWNMFTAKKGDDKLQTFWSQKTKIQINVTKSTFFYDGQVKNVTYTVTPEDAKDDIKVTYKTIAEQPAEVSADTIKHVGSYYVIFTYEANDTYLALNDTVTMTINEKAVPTVSEMPKPTTVEAGQPLSMSFLSGGKAEVDGTPVLGTFAWADANMILKEGEHNYAVVFTPANLAEMEVAIDSVKIKAKRYFTVTTGVSANGKATIDGKSASNRYVKDTTLNFVITPETGYEFTGWNGTNNKAASYKYKVEKDTSFVAGFAKKKFTVTVTDPGNSNTLTVKYKDADGKDQSISSQATLDYGTVLTVTATAAGDYNAESISATGSTLSKGQIFLDANTTISATFVAKPETPKTVAVTAPEGGTIRLTDKATGKEIVAGSSVKSGTAIIIERTPNKGYKLKDATQARTEQTVSDNVTITASFEKEVYTIKQETGDGYTLTVNKKEGHYGDQVTVSYAVEAGYKAVALMVNAKEVPNNSTFTLTENTTVQAIVKEKATIAVNNEVKQSYVYNGHNQPFVVKTTPAGLDSVSVSYSKDATTVSTPVDAGTYTVHINRPEDENFKALDATATLVITKAPIVITKRPEKADSEGVASVAGTWSSGAKPNDAVQPMTKALKSTSDVAIFTPTSSNYAVGYCTPGNQMDMKVTIEQPTNGTITVWDGNLQITDNGANNALKNTELRVIATPAEGYKFEKWESGITSNTSGASATVTSSKDITFTATFVDKETLSPSITENASAEYDGTVKGGNLKITANTSVTTGNTSVTTGWSYSFQQNEMTVVPVNAGKYDVVVTRAADADCKACRVVLTNAFEIKKATPTITATPAATVAKGAMLYSAEVTGGAASTDGTFVWKSADEAINADATKEMIFVPSDKDNFKEVKVTGVEVKTTNLQVISFVQPENGTITVKRGETVLASGDPIAEGDELTITATAASGYELESLKVADKTFTNGSTYEVVGDATVNVVATMKKTQGGGGDPVVPVSVSSVSLDKSALTLPRLDSYTLIATVNPSNATNKSVTWKSSDESIAKVDANGKVTAVKIGKATITVTTVDGYKTATCLVTVDFATGIEEMLAQTEVYSQQGNIIVNPVQPLQLTIVNMTGQTVYNDYISGSTQIPARSGVYIVKLSNAGNTIISKLIVR